MAGKTWISKYGQGGGLSLGFYSWGFSAHSSGSRNQCFRAQVSPGLGPLERGANARVLRVRGKAQLEPSEMRPRRTSALRSPAGQPVRNRLSTGWVSKLTMYHIASKGKCILFPSKLQIVFGIPITYRHYKPRLEVSLLKVITDMAIFISNKH